MYEQNIVYRAYWISETIKIEEVKRRESSMVLNTGLKAVGSLSFIALTSKTNSVFKVCIQYLRF